MSDNWVVQNLENALETWNSKLSEIWQLLTTSPQQFKGGSIWSVMVNINGAVQAIGLALLVLFFVVGVVRTCGSFTDVKKPEHALKLFIRFAIAKGVITYGLELMLALFDIVQGTISTIMTSAGFGTPNQTTLPAEMVTTIESCGFFESIPLWAVTLIGGLFITVLSFITLATMAIDKGMPIEQLQQLLGHRKMPFLRFREEGQHYGYELFLSPPKHWGSRGAPLWWAYAARKFTYDKLPMDEQFFYEKYKSIVQEFGMKIYSNHLRSVYKELHADRETGC